MEGCRKALEKNNRALLVVPLALLTFWALFVLILRTNFGLPVRIFGDDGDKVVYFFHASWFSEQRTPYVDVFSEYPQVPTYLFAFPNVVHALLFPGAEVSYRMYDVLFSGLMLVFLGATVLVLADMLPRSRRHYAYLLFLPGTLYFTINRFDILPALLCLLATRSLQNGRFSFAAVCLGVATLTKWYPVLLLPVFLIYEYRTRRALPLRTSQVFVLTCLLILLPTYWTGGMDALLVPYRLHAARTLEPLSLPAMVDLALVRSGVQLPVQWLIWLFLFLQVAGLLLVVMFIPIKRLPDLHLASVLIIGCFMLFARIYSPQWLLWLFPFLVLSIQSRRDIVFLALYGIEVYLGFPVVFDAFGRTSSWICWMSGLNMLFLVTTVVVTFVRARRAVDLGTC